MSDPTQTPAPPADPDPSRASRLIQALVALAIVAAFLLVFLGAFLTHDTQMKHDLVLVLIAAIYTVLNFYFGSSAGSKIKDVLRGRGG